MRWVPGPIPLKECPGDRPTVLPSRSGPAHHCHNSFLVNLKLLSIKMSGLKMPPVEFDENTLSPTYRLLWGIPGRSNALTIARRLGLKAEILDRAQASRNKATDDINQVIAGLEAQRRRQKTKAQRQPSSLQVLSNCISRWRKGQ